MKKRIISLLVALCMVSVLLPTTTFAYTYSNDYVTITGPDVAYRNHDYTFTISTNFDNEQRCFLDVIFSGERYLLNIHNGSGNLIEPQYTVVIPHELYQNFSDFGISTETWQDPNPTIGIWYIVPVADCVASGTEVRNAKDANCTEDGYTGDTYCLGCNTKLADGKTITKSGHIDTDKNHVCDRENCKATISSCNGGTATCKDPAICDYCGKPYGELNASNHVGRLVLLNMENYHAHCWSCCGMFAEVHTPIDQNNDLKCDTCEMELEGLVESEVEIVEPVESITEEVEQILL